MDKQKTQSTFSQFMPLIAGGMLASGMRTISTMRREISGRLLAGMLANYYKDCPGDQLDLMPKKAIQLTDILLTELEKTTKNAPLSNHRSNANRRNNPKQRRNNLSNDKSKRTKK